MNETQLTISEPKGIALNSIAEMADFSERVVKSRMAPKGFDTPEAVLIAIQMGAELGLAPMSALQNIAVINGRPSIWGDAALAIVRASNLMEVFEERLERGEKEEDFAAFCKVQRKGYASAETKFSVADAKKAGLWGKAGPWTQYPKRMLQMRARAFALRDTFTDVLKGFRIAEEVSDYQEMKQVTVRERKQIELPDEQPEPATEVQEGVLL